MRIRAKWRGTPGKDRVKEASKRLRVILKTSKKLGVTSDDLDGLGSVGLLRTTCRGHEPSNWLFFCVLGVCVLLSVVILVFACGGLPQLLNCGKNTTKEIQIPTMRLDRLSLDGSTDKTEDATLFNDSEDSEDGHLWQSPNLRLRRER